VVENVIYGFVGNLTGLPVVKEFKQVAQLSQRGAL